MKRKIKSSEGGFTLIEILISTAIFSGLLTAATGFLVLSVRSQARAGLERTVAQSARFALEKIEREFRSVGGIKDSFGRKLKPPFEISGLTGPNCQPESHLRGPVGNKLVLFDQNGDIFFRRTIETQVDSSKERANRLMMKTETFADRTLANLKKTESFDLLDPRTGMVDLDGTPDEFCVIGYQPTAGSAQQPYVIIKLKLANRDFVNFKPDKQVTLELKTTLSSRDYQFN